LKIRDVNPEDLAEVHCRIGHALWQIQGCEDVLVYFIGTVLKMPPSRARHEAMAVVDQLRTCTLGGLIAELRKAKSTGSVSEFESRVNHFLNERNWLVHHSWRENHADLFNPERIPRLFKRLEALSQEASDKLWLSIVAEWIARPTMTCTQPVTPMAGSTLHRSSGMMTREPFGLRSWPTAPASMSMRTRRIGGFILSWPA
jgi:hypothetical protein